MRLKNKIVLVTGGYGLLGSAIVNNIITEGGFVINADISAQTRDDLSEVYCDISDQASVKSLVIRIKQQYGKVDALVNNAYPRTNDWGLKFEDIPYGSWKENIDLQLNSIFYMSQQIIELMKISEGGSIVNMSSIYGVVGPDFSVYDNTNMTMPAAYSAIKGGIVNFTRYLAAYLGKYNIRVNCVSPGGIFDNQNPTFVRNYEAKVPLKRMGTPDDIAPSICFLISDDGKYITGQNLIIDGGWTCI